MERQSRMRRFNLHKTRAPERENRGASWEDNGWESSRTDEKT